MNKKTVEELEQEEVQVIEDDLVDAGDDLLSWLDTLSGVHDKTIKLIRVQPEKWGGQKISGHLTTLPPDSRITEDEIKEEYGGGTYQIRVFIRDKKGQFKQVRARNVDISGMPKIPIDLDQRGGNGKVEDPEVTKLVLDKMEKVADESRDRADRIEKELRESGKLDPDIISAFTDPLKEQVHVYREELRDLKATMEALRNQKPDTSAFERMAESERLRAQEERREAKEFRSLLMQKPDTSSQDRLIEALVTNKASEINQIRTAFESERRQLIDAHNDEVKRINDRYDRMLETLKEDNKRLVDSIREDHKRIVDDYKRSLDSAKEDSKRQVDNTSASYEHRIKTLELAYQGTENILKERIESLKNELASTKGELTKVRDEKQKSPIEVIEDLVTLKESLSALRDESDEEDDTKATWEKVADRVEPIIGAFAQRFGSGGGLTPEQMMLLDQQNQAKLTARQATEQVETQEVQEETSVDVEKFVSFTEASISNGRDPETFTSSARNLVPKQLLDELVKLGPDALADAVAAQRPESVIASQAGRTFLRKVVEILKSSPPVDSKG